MTRFSSSAMRLYATEPRTQEYVLKYMDFYHLQENMKKKVFWTQD